MTRTRLVVAPLSVTVPLALFVRHEAHLWTYIAHGVWWPREEEEAWPVSKR